MDSLCLCHFSSFVILDLYILYVDCVLYCLVWKRRIIIIDDSEINSNCIKTIVWLLFLFKLRCIILEIIYATCYFPLVVSREDTPLERTQILGSNYYEYSGPFLKGPSRKDTPL